MAKFPTMDWLTALMEKLNTDAKYAEVAKNWEGDMKFVIDPAGPLTQSVIYYIDLWHGKCRGVRVLEPADPQTAAFVLKAPYDNFSRLIRGDMDPIQAMLTRKVNVQGNMIVMMRNVPTVMDFVRCCRENTDSFL